MPATCPFCGSSKVATANEKVDSSTYGRCEACAQMWNVGRLRASGRDGYGGVDMSTTVAEADWIKRIADDERKRDTVVARESELAARKADLVRLNGRRLIDELR